MLYQIYNHLTLRPTALMLGGYKSYIALLGMVNLLRVLAKHKEARLSCRAKVPILYFILVIVIAIGL